jgi:hypothetical protein
MQTRIHQATTAEYIEFYHHEPLDSLVGFCAKRDDGKIVAFAFCFLDPHGRVWVGIDNAAQVPPLMLHRKIREMLTALREEGVGEVFACCDERIARAAEWLRRLGFAIDASVAPVYMRQVDKEVPVWRRALR